MNKSAFLLSRNTLIAICLAMGTGMLLFGLWPFHYLPSNQVAILEDGAGIRFYGRGEALSIGDNAWPMADYSGQPITLELNLKPLKTYHESVPQILSLCDRSGREIFYLGQWKNHLVMRLLGENRWFTRVERKAGTPDLLMPGKTVSLTFVFSSGGVDLYTDGTPAGTVKDFDLSGTIDHRPVRSVILGNSSTCDQPWRGEIHGFSVFARVLDPTAVRNLYVQRESGEKSTMPGEVIRYRFEEPLGEIVRNDAGPEWDLLIPKNLTPIRREFLSLPSADNLEKGWFYGDAWLNLAGFIPLGFILARLFTAPGTSRRSRSIILPLAAGFLLSLFIEANQSFLVTRTSSITDLVLNSLGTLGGALLFLSFPRLRSPGPRR